MVDKKGLIETYLDTYHLMHRYHMMWYGKNFGARSRTHFVGVAAG